MSFYNPYAFLVLVILLILLFIKGKKRNFEEYFSPYMLKRIRIGQDQKKLNFTLLLLSFIFLVIALARPIIENKPIVVSQSSVSLIVAFDISKSMMANDVYPNRLLFAKNKFYQATNKEEIETIYEEIDSLEKSKIKSDQLVKKTYLYQYPLDIAIGLLFILLLVQRRGL